MITLKQECAPEIANCSITEVLLPNTSQESEWAPFVPENVVTVAKAYREMSTLSAMLMHFSAEHEGMVSLPSRPSDTYSITGDRLTYEIIRRVLYYLRQGRPFWFVYTTGVALSQLCIIHVPCRESALNGHDQSWEDWVEYVMQHLHGPWENLTWFMKHQDRAVDLQGRDMV